MSLTGNAMSGEIGLIDQLMRAGGSIFQTGAKMASTGRRISSKQDCLSNISIRKISITTAKTT
ncbi:hypothetical protein CEW81_18325 [Kluyvera genomosp. 3]|uniref:Uncharacterized protein n=1 Tax=Kluyvera genomosp. 3 TaxID=2774055 RepID=A0A248KJE9_9ENTR|nr:hypothetical protein CEW81_18325 [Kluyvera genomosp. 3]